MKNGGQCSPSRVTDGDVSPGPGQDSCRGWEEGRMRWHFTEERGNGRNPTEAKVAGTLLGQGDILLLGSPRWNAWNVGFWYPKNIQGGWKRLNELGSVKCHACYLPEFPGLLHCAPLSPESPTFALSGIKWSESVKQVDLNGDSLDGWSMSLLQGLDARRTGWLITQIRYRVKIHRGVIRCFISTHPPLALLETHCWPCCALCGIPDLSGPSIRRFSFYILPCLRHPSMTVFERWGQTAGKDDVQMWGGAAPMPQRWRKK